jgi:hypothetical protein
MDKANTKTSVKHNKVNPLVQMKGKTVLNINYGIDNLCNLRGM